MITTLQSKVAIGFLLAGLVLAFILVVQIRYITGLLNDSAEVERTHEVKRHFDKLFSLVKDLERGHRGYVISGDAEYLEPYYAAEEAIPQELKTLERLIKDPAQDRRLLAVQPLIEQELAFSKESIRLRNEKGPAAAVEFRWRRSPITRVFIPPQAGRSFEPKKRKNSHDVCSFKSDRCHTAN